MILYALDTDHLSLILRGHPKIRERLTAVSPEEVAITIITVEEQLRGRLAQVSKASTGDARSIAYRYLHKAINPVSRTSQNPGHPNAHQVQAVLAGIKSRSVAWTDP